MVDHVPTWPRRVMLFVGGSEKTAQSLVQSVVPFDLDCEVAHTSNGHKIAMAHPFPGRTAEALKTKWQFVPSYVNPRRHAAYLLVHAQRLESNLTIARHIKTGVKKTVLCTPEMVTSIVGTVTSIVGTVSARLARQMLLCTKLYRCVLVLSEIL